MKYYLIINQRAIHDLGLQDALDPNSCLIFDVLRYWMNSPECESFKEDGVTYYWVSTKWLLNELPILHCNSAQAIAKYIQRLEDAGLIVKYWNNRGKGRAYYAKGKNWDKMDNFSTQSTSNQASKNNYPHTTIVTSKELDSIEQSLHGTNNIPRVEHTTNVEDKREQVTDNNELRVFSAQEAQTQPQEEQGKIFEGEIGFIDRSEKGNNFVSEEEKEKLRQKKEKRTKAVMFEDDEQVAEFSAFLTHFQGEEWRKVDLEYYYNTIKDWSAGDGKKKLDWVATARNWMRRDKKEGKLKQREMTPQERMMEQAREDYAAAQARRQQRGATSGRNFMDEILH